MLRESPTACTHIETGLDRVWQRRDDSGMDRLDLRKPVPHVRLEVVHERPEDGSQHSFLGIPIPGSGQLKLGGRNRRYRVFPDWRGKPLEVLDSEMTPARRCRYHRGGEVHD